MAKKTIPAIPPLQDEAEKDAIVQVTEELCRVAKGMPVTDLRGLVSRLCPKEKDAATAYVEMLQRLRSAAEAAVHVATEVASSVYNARG